uniref:F-box domain-containing protein n=1 Tax=Oryza barthii TaxID=65489 RepID=A0A0D3FM68_9ORYZ
MVAALPDDVLAEVLRRLGPRSLAACCRVCKPWRDLVDDRRLLRADLLPRSLAGIFLNFSGLCYPEFFARPSTTAGATTAISSLLDFLPFDGTKWYKIEDHCNGLLLLDRDCVEINYQKEEGSLSSYEWFRKKLEYELNEEATLEKSEWNSDDDNAPCNEDIIGRYNEAIDIIGFHPFKEIIFFSESFERGIAYHLNGSKVEDLGDLYPVGYDFVPSNEQMISASYPYTPC